MKYYCISDIHGYLSPLKSLIKKIKLNPEDKIILMGDYIDRGYNSIGVLKYIKVLKQQLQDQLILLWGNHEDMFAAAHGLTSLSDLDTEFAYRVWWTNGGKEALLNTNEANLVDAFLEIQPHLLPYHTDTYVDTYQQIVFAHASFPHGQSESTNYKPILWAAPSPAMRNDINRLLITGHVPQLNGFSNGINHICIDAGSFLYHRLCMLKIDTENSTVRDFILHS